MQLSAVIALDRNLPFSLLYNVMPIAKKGFGRCPPTVLQLYLLPREAILVRQLADHARMLGKVC